MTAGRGGGPPQDAYSRVTNPERYRPLHDAVGELLDRLTDEYAVERADVQPFGSRADVDDCVQLTPSSGSGAPLTVAFTGFPGVFIRYGNWLVVAYPHCGCDACDEKVDHLVDEMASRVESLVRGEFQERLTRRRLETEFGSASRSWSVLPGGRRRGAWLDRDLAAKLGKPGRSNWGPWVRRTK